MAEGDSSKRQVAHKVRVADILNNRYIKEEGWLPNYIAVGDVKVSRANLLGVIVSKGSQDGDASQQGFILDDGTGRVALRFFEQSTALEVGDIVNVIGRPREFGAERYVVPEVMRKVSGPKWVEVRKLELALAKKLMPTTQETSGSDVLSAETEDMTDDTNPLTKIIDIIKQLDAGAGAGFDEISVKFKGGDPEEFVKRLLEQGDIFEVKPGRYKVLE